MQKPWWKLPFLILLILSNNWWIRQLPMLNGSWEEWLLLLITILNIGFFHWVIITEEKSYQNTKWTTISLVFLIPLISYIFIADSDWSILELFSYGLFLLYCIGQVGYKVWKLLK